ncbi:hypothetical protein KSS87_019838, partial [Heliosperma pusillum]
MYLDVAKLVIFGTLMLLSITIMPSPAQVFGKQEDEQDKIKCWKNVYDCLAEHSNSTDPRFNRSSTSFNITETMCCSLVQYAAKNEKMCFCEVNTFVQQNASYASNVNLLLATCKVTTSIAALGAFCQVDVPPPSAPSPTSGHSKIIVAIAVPTVIVLVVIAVIAGLCYWKKNQLRTPQTKSGKLPPDESTERALYDIVSIDSLHYEWGILKAATNNFSDDNKLGQGGFGAVYKVELATASITSIQKFLQGKLNLIASGFKFVQGILPDGQEVAVKRLSNNSRQGEKEFKNEVAVVANLQHRNLVKLVGFCLEKEEKLLVYEFMLNKSLNYLLFDPRKQRDLDWQTRCNIIKGVARGMLYLHEDSHLRIIHRDLKAANVLLDSEMNPRIADFGMAKIFNYDQSHCNTSKVAGTHGYMAPEYLFHGQFSVKSDVYSFGVLVLEIISGRRIIGPPNRSGGHESLLSYLGLLCVEEDYTMRPSMSTIVHILSSNFAATALSKPQHPAFIYPAN